MDKYNSLKELKNLLACTDLNVHNPIACCLTDKLQLFSVELILNLRNFEIQGVTIQNPIGSGKIMLLDSILGGSTFLPANPSDQPLNYRSAIQIIISRGAGISEFVLTPKNLNFGLPDNSVMGAFLTNNLGTTEITRAIEVLGPFSFNFAGKIIIPPGHNVGVHLVGINKVDASDPTQCALTVIWYELNLPA